MVRISESPSFQQKFFRIWFKQFSEFILSDLWGLFWDKGTRSGVWVTVQARLILWIWELISEFRSKKLRSSVSDLIFKSLAMSLFEAEPCLCLERFSNI